MVEKSLSALATAACAALLAGRDETRCKAFLLENQCILSLSEDAEELRDKVDDVEKAYASAKDTFAKIREKKLRTV